MKYSIVTVIDECVYTSTYFSNVRWQLYCLLQILDTGSHVVPGLPLRPGQAGAVSAVQGRGGQGGVGLGGAQVRECR